MPQNTLISLNIPQHDQILLNVPNMPENTCINCSDYARVLKMLQYSYNNIIIVTNVIILELVSAQCVHPGALLSFYLFLTQVRTASKLLINYSF